MEQECLRGSLMIAKLSLSNGTKISLLLSTSHNAQIEKEIMLIVLDRGLNKPWTQYLLPVNEQQGAQLKGNGGQKINRTRQKYNDAEERGCSKMFVGWLSTPLILIRELCHNHLMCGIVIIIRINTLITIQWHITQSASNIGIYLLARGASH